MNVNKIRAQCGAIALALCLLAGMTQTAQAAQPTVRISAGSGMLDVEVATTQSERTHGLMQRGKMPQTHGMIFIYPAPAYFCMWMKNTLLPLSVAFVDAQGQVINVEEMAPQTETNHCPQRNAVYAIEANRGWFSRHGVVPGTQILGLENMPPGEY